MANRSNKRHDYLALRDRRAIQNATEFALKIDLPLTMAVTVHWAHADGPCAGNWRTKFSYLIRLCKRWMQARGVTWAATAVHEQGSSKELPHTHFAIHVPARLFASFEAELKRRTAGHVESVVAVRPIKPPQGAMGWARYQTKAIHPRYLDTVSPPVRTVDRDKIQGPIVGRRSYVSRAIGEAAQTGRGAGHTKAPALTGDAETNQRIIERWQRRQGAA